MLAKTISGLGRRLVIAALVLLPIAAITSCSTGPANDSDRVGKVSQALTDCNGIPEWTVKTYQGGDRVQHGGRLYECKPWPFSGWCGQAGYEPGVTAYWQDAWIDVDACGTPPGSGGAGGGGGEGGGAGSPGDTPEAGSCDTVECCPENTTPVILTEQPDQLLNTQPDRCIVALGGSDNIHCAAPNCTVLGGPEPDVIMAGEGALVRGGDGSDSINGFTSSTVLGNAGDDTIAAANGDNFVYPGAGADNVACGDGDDTVAIYDLCEVAAGEVLDGGGGHDTLITPVSVEDLEQLGVEIANFEAVLVQPNSCRSDCVQKPSCPANAMCAEGDAPGEVGCKCKPGFFGPDCQICVPAVDSDEDGVLDCQDECPFDASKTQRGRCPCGVSDADSDGDGTPNCIDLCPDDPSHVTPGKCGCLGIDRSQAVVGSACVTPACPGQNHATCNENAVCGDPNACRPDPSCNFVETPGSNYFVCGGSTAANRSFASAQQACAAQGLSLARVETFSENQRLKEMLSGPAWLGGNSLAAAGDWRWSSGANSSGDAFWSGGADGAVVAGRFAYWSAEKPGSGRCLVLDPSDGRWRDETCSESLPYVCEHAAPGFFGPTPELVRPGQPPEATIPCVHEDQTTVPFKPDELDAMEAQAAAAEQGIFDGAAKDPPTSDTSCPEDPNSNSCGLVDGGVPGSSCETDQDCAQLGAGHICRPIKDPSCTLDLDAGDTSCPTINRCGISSCPTDETPNRCQQFEVCEDPNSTFEPVIQGGSDLDAGPLDPANFFEAAPVSDASTEFSDPPDAAVPGAHHAWCRLQPQATGKVQPAQTETTKKGKSGGGPISFDFDPNLRFDVNPKALAFGETNMLLTAAASLRASLVLNNFLKLNKDLELIDAVAAVTAERCRVHTNQSHVRILGRGFTDLLPKQFFFDTHDSATFGDVGRKCDAALARFQEAADRAKKAFRDAQQLLEQYELLKDDPVKFGSDLCGKLIAVDKVIPGFPGGNLCPHGEPPELTINRFIWYFQFGPNNQLEGVSAAAAELSRVSDELLGVLQGKFPISGSTDFQVPLTVPLRSETFNLFSTTFSIGPVPVRIEVDAATAYGITGSLDFGLDFPLGPGKSAGQDDGRSPAPANLAHARVHVEPQAGASMILFAGVGGSIASAGVEGSVNLANISAPVHAGAGLGVTTVRDERDPPEGDDNIGGVMLKGVANAFPFGPGVGYKFYLTYDYGVGINIRNILSGKVNGRVRVKFAFFSRTWRKKIYEFKGFSLEPIELLKGGGRASLFDVGTSRTVKADDITPMGISEPQVPLVLLEPLELPEGEVLAAGAEFDAGKVDRLFYDDLCCSEEEQACGTPDLPGCCPDLACVDGRCCNADTGRCECGSDRQSCSVDTDCCSGLTCSEGSCTGSSCAGPLGLCDESACCDGLTCRPSETPFCCIPVGSESYACAQNSECCSNMCESGACFCSVPGEPCQIDANCCSGAVCVDDGEGAARCQGT